MTVTAPALRLGLLGRNDDRPAIIESGRGTISYRDLNALADRVADRLRASGVRPGARVGVYLRRSADAVAAMLGILRAECAYVPVDPRAPAERAADIHQDCQIHTTFVERRFTADYLAALGRRGSADVAVQEIVVDSAGQGIAAWTAGAAAAVSRSPDGASPPGLACILYTSGTTGRPKGWMMTRRAIEAHVGWVHRVLAPSDTDVFANHAQFNFGMSLFDIYSSLGAGVPLVLVPDEVRHHASGVVNVLVRDRVSIWFSGPAILGLIGQLPALPAEDLVSLRVVAFAGEVFPWLRLKALRERLPKPRYFNFYGSTETNVAAYYEIPPTLDLEGPPPFGRACEHYEMRLVDSTGAPTVPGQIGELQFRGGGLTTGYWGQADLTTAKLRPAADGGGPWFASGDQAVELPTGDFRYAGRIGRMIKLRGYRVEPGEIEGLLYQHPLVIEAGVVPVESPFGLELVAHLSTSTGERLSIVELKEFCARQLPAYMIPERFEFHSSLPRTSTGKIDLQALRHAGPAFA